MDVGAWLRGLGLGPYEQAFRDNDVDADLLLTLTADDLRELGVASLGHRRRLLKAIKGLRDGAAWPRAPASSLPAPATRSEAERRQLTVNFCDLGGVDRDVGDARSRGHARGDPRLPERGRGRGRALRGPCCQVHGYEDEAERAVRAGLAITAATGQLSSPAGEALAARVAIATGLVVVGDLVGEGAAQEQAVVGDTPNFAARLQGIAAPGQVVIADATRRLLGAGFELADLGEHELKGIAGMFSSAAHSRAGSCYSRLADLPALFRAPDP